MINSLNMSLEQRWRDCAKYYPGRNHVIDECVTFHNRATGGKVVFWDTRGFEGIHEDEHAVLILRYVLEGRIPPKCIPCVLLMGKDTIKKRYHRVADPHRRIDMVLYVSDYSQPPQIRLMGLLAQAMNMSKIVCVNSEYLVSLFFRCLLTSAPSSSPISRRGKHCGLRKYFPKTGPTCG